MNRVRIEIEAIADLHNLANAAYLAAKGKRAREPVARFFESFDANVQGLREGLLGGDLKLGRGRRFSTRDPKPREIFAPIFEERVVHHALMRYVGPVLESALMDDSFACRVGKGSLAAMLRARRHASRFAWFAKMDVRAYFASIDHENLVRLLRRKIKGDGVIALIRRIVDSYETAPGKGLPIGSLTSQCFANFYLAGLDRYIKETLGAQGYVRYMDDFAFWTYTKASAETVVQAADEYLSRELGLAAKPGTQINRSSRGITICGYRVKPDSIRLTLRRKRSFMRQVRVAERAYRKVDANAAALQRAHQSALAVTLHADALAWRRSRLHGLDGVFQPDEV